jgi:hypothetical protein
MTQFLEGTKRILIFSGVSVVLLRIVDRRCNLSISWVEDRG